MKRYKLKRDLPAFKAGTECYIEEAGHMVPCRGISYVIVHKKQLKQNPNILDDWFEEINESTRWKPEMGQTYYHVGGDGRVYDDTWVNDSAVDNGRFEIGNCSKTEEEAKRVIEYLKALAVVRGDATSKFTEDESNYYVYYSFKINSLRLGCSWNCIKNGTFDLPYFATEEDAKRSIELHRNEWLTIFGVEDEK